jgi:probable HAF family extracellular repeat protein
MTGIHFIGTLGGFESQAFGVSADGSVVVGRSTNASNERHAFRWTAAGGMQDLGTLGGHGSEAFDVSADGSVIVGDSADSTGSSRAFRWTAASGMKSLSALYSASLGSGSYLAFANGISGDGLHVVGYGYNRRNARYEAFITN